MINMDIEMVARSLEGLPEVLEGLFAHLSDEILSFRPESEAWSIKEIIGHLIEADRYAFEERIGFIINQDGVDIPAWSANQAAAAREDNSLAFHQLLEELQTQRVQAAAFVRTLDPATLSNKGRIEKYGTFLASDFLFEWPYHDYDHLQQMMACLKPIPISHMSDTMRRALNS